MWPSAGATGPSRWCRDPPARSCSITHNMRSNFTCFIFNIIQLEFWERKAHISPKSRNQERLQMVKSWGSVFIKRLNQHKLSSQF